ncbi:hypothetical protein CU097_006965 [Rhizopus azygosporus]|uniref:Cytochrome P450-dit2 n=2 Tax=Rhizopus TaxID=4842 RepID=A0A367J310_RHIAZ|nr:cytochrome P450 [Rhizopus microsporus]RCH84322.1 hypothetical protein CU097_006965 [Rhizopus azygosporus]
MDTYIMNKEHQKALAASGIALALTIYLIKRVSDKKNKTYKEIPYPAGSTNWPIFGHMLSLGSTPVMQFKKWHEETGPIYKVRMGKQTWVMISDPYLAHEIFVKNGANTSSRPYHRFNSDIYARNSRGVVFTQYTPEWKNNRKMAASLLAPASVDKFSGLIEYEFGCLMDRLKKVAKEGVAINPFRELQLTGLNIILTVLVGTRYDHINNPFASELNKLIDQGMVYSGATGDLASLVPSLAWIGTLFGLDKKMTHFIKQRCDPFYDKLIQDALERDVDSLAKSLNKMKEEGLISGDDMHVLITDLIAAGSDTVSVTLYWTLAILALQPNVQAKIIQELDAWKADHVPGAIPSFHQDREAFPYTICVQKEMIRYRPATSYGIPHVASEDIVAGGYLIPKGAVLISSMNAMHMNENIYENANSFDPERFKNNTSRMAASANSKVDDRDVFAFGWGRRMCLGIHLAELELFSFYVRFFSEFTIEPELDAQGNPVPINIEGFVDEGVVNKPLPYKVRFVPRS